MKIKSQLHNFFYSPYLKLNRIERAVRVGFLSAKLFCQEEYSRQATALTYYTLFAIVPLAALFFGIAKGFAFESKLKGMLSERFAEHQETLTWIYKFADTTLREASGGIIAGVGVFMLFATVIMLASSIEDTFNMIWDLRQKRAMINKVTNYLAILVITPIMLIIVSAVPVVERIIMGYIAEAYIINTSLPFIQFAMDILPIFIACLFFSVIYYIVPNTKVRISSAVISGIFSGVLFFYLQSSLIVLQVMLSKYNTIYGSFSIVPLFLIWLQWSWLIVLFGAKIAYVHQNASSGKFDQDAKTFNNTYKQVYSLAITQMICRNFANNQGATNEFDIIDFFQLNRYRAAALIDDLLECNIISQQSCDDKKQRKFLPAYPTEKLTPLFVLNQLDGEFETNIELNEELEDILKRYEKLKQRASESRSNRSLAD